MGDTSGYDRISRNLNSSTGPIYHYTTFESLYRILHSRQLWVSRSDFLNDPTELKLLNDRVYQLVHRYKANTSLDPEFGKNLETWLSDVTNFSSDWFLRDLDVYVLSLSEQDDVYTLWRNYGKQGCNLEFPSPSVFMNGWNSHARRGIVSVIPGRVIYDLDRQVDLIEEELLSWSTDMQSLMASQESLGEKQFELEIESRNKMLKIFCLFIGLSLNNID